MRHRAFIISAVASAAIVHAQVTQPVESDPRSTRFDGTWSVVLTCADYKDADVGAKGYTFRFLAEIKNGQLSAQYGRVGAPGYYNIRVR